VRVRLRRETALAALDYHDFLYEIERIEKTASGACVFDLTHFPIDAQGRSLVALEVAAATAPGVVIASGRSDYSCDDNSSTPGIDVGIEGIDFPAFDDTPDLTDTTVDLDPPVDDEWATGGDSPIGPDVSQPIDEPIGGQTPIGGWGNPADPLEQSRDQDGIGYITGGTGPDGAPQVGDTLSVDPSAAGCSDHQMCWSKIDKNTNEESNIECQSGPGTGTLSITTNELDHYIAVKAQCKDPSTPDGWGAPQRLGQTKAVAMAPFFWEIAWAKALYRESASNFAGQDCSLQTFTFDPNNLYTFPGNGGASGSVAPGLIWLEQDIFTWNQPGYTCPYPPGSGVWYQLKPELPDGTVIQTGSNIIGKPRVTSGTTSVTFYWWETGVAVGYGATLAEAQDNAAAQLP
jgi:hypothetical protein